YVADWIEGWDKTDKGRIYRVFDPKSVSDSTVAETKEILVQGMTGRSRRQLTRLLEHPDRRVRMEAQFEFAGRGTDSIDTLSRVAAKNEKQLARLHAIWGLGQIGRSYPVALQQIVPPLMDEDSEVRAQAAKIAGEHRMIETQDQLIALLHDASARVRFFAASGLGKLQQASALEPIFQMLRENADRDPYLRHAGIMALAGINDMNALISAAKESNPSVRLACLLAMRRLNRPEIAMFLYDSEPQILVESVRAIYDLPLESAFSQLATLSGQLPKLPAFQNFSKSNVDLRTAFLRRVINAHYRLGNLENCVSLAEFAANASNSESLRAEALELLRDWAKPAPRDRLLGLWRPLPERNARGAGLALRSHLPEILKNSPDPVRIVAAQCAAKLGLRQASSVLFDLIGNSSLSAQVKIESLRALIAFEDSNVRDALTLAMADKEESVRREATQWFAKLNPNDAITPLAMTLDTGTVGEKQTALKSLAELKSPIVDRILLSWLDLLLNGKLPNPLHLDVLEASANRNSAEVKTALDKVLHNRTTSESAASLPELLYGGDPEAGRKIFVERQDAACVRCHKADTEGGDVGPNLHGVGTLRSREYILESILFPNKEITENYATEIVTMNDGSQFAGIKKNETNTELVLNSPDDGLLVLAKDEIQVRKHGLSAMPAEIASILSKREIRDLVAFLATLK
ncbi:MAG: HEAT repeat domain-containing protein, partial [Verrucomicrobia bacterium]|nr:HEAT repeat domain-containing protein [Verrucomicrobiota bacterium]